MNLQIQEILDRYFQQQRLADQSVKAITQWTVYSNYLCHLCIYPNIEDLLLYAGGDMLLKERTSVE